MKIHIHQNISGYWQVVYIENNETKFEFLVESKEQAHELALDIAIRVGRLSY